MANQLRATFSEIADAIRTKSGTTEPISARNFANAILNLNTGTGGSKITVYTLIQPCTAIPIDSTTMINNIYFNISLSEAEVISIIDNAFISVPGWVNDMGAFAYVAMNQSSENSGNMVIVQGAKGSYLIQIVSVTEGQENNINAFVSGPIADEIGVSFTGWNPDFNGEFLWNGTNEYLETIATNQNKLEKFTQINEALKELISSTPF